MEEITILGSAHTDHVTLLSNDVSEERLHKHLIQRVLLETDDDMVHHRPTEHRVLHERTIVLHVAERLVVVGQNPVADMVAVDVVRRDSSQLPRDVYRGRVQRMRLRDDPYQLRGTETITDVHRVGATTPLAPATTTSSTDIQTHYKV